jgi:hypothetical protein
MGGGEGGRLRTSEIERERSGKNQNGVRRRGKGGWKKKNE